MIDRSGVQVAFVHNFASIVFGMRIGNVGRREDIENPRPIVHMLGCQWLVLRECSEGPRFISVISYPMHRYEVASVWLGTTPKFLHTYFEAIQAFKCSLQHVILLHMNMQHILQSRLVWRDL